MSFQGNAARNKNADQTPELIPAPGRVPPNDLDAEAAVLSAILLDTSAFDQVQDTLRAEHFYADANKRVFEAVLELQNVGRPVDVVSVAGYLRDRNRLEQIGGTPYLAQLVDATPAVAHVAAHAQAVREKWRVRQLIATCQRFAAEGYASPPDTQKFIDLAEQAVFDIARTQQGSQVEAVRDAVVRAFKILEEAERRGGGITGIPTGFSRLDRQVSGLHAGDLYIVAARPGMGKTSFVLNMALNVAATRGEPSAPANAEYFEAPVEDPGYSVLFCSLEMPKEQLAARLLASEAQVDMSNIRSGRMSREDWSRMTDAASRLARLPLYLDDTPALTLLDLRAKIRRLQAEVTRGEGSLRTKGLGLVVIDYLQLMQGRRDAGSREQEISELSRGLKQLAKEMRVPVIALSQLNRAVETRTAKDKRPQLSDLRESGAIEQDADTIIFIYRDEYYFKDSEAKNVAEIIVAKQRNGPTGTVLTKFTSAFTRFDNLEAEEFEVDQFDDFAAGP
jgi:replicative DNA helicase